MTVRELTHKADSREIAEWVAYLGSEDAQFDDWAQTAQICATLVNVARVAGLGKVPGEVKLKDFMPVHQRKRTAQTADEQIAMLKSMAGG